MNTSMPRLAAGFALLALAATAAAQEPPRNAAYVELGGNGVLPTLNYERRFTDHWAGRIGFMVVSSEEDGGDSETTLFVPLVASYITHPRRNHHFEAGGGLLLVTGEEQDLFFGEEDDTISNVAVTALAGYRYQRPGRGFLFRGGLTPIYTEGELYALAGISFGYSW